MKITMEKKMMTVTRIFTGFYFSRCGGVPYRVTAERFEKKSGARAPLFLLHDWQ
jgi:hypothetical protein